MHKVVTIHLHGHAYQLEEAGYEALHAYLDQADRQLQDNPDREEILADIEQAVAEKCRALLSPHRTVVATAEIQRILGEIGPVRDDSAPESGSGGGAATAAAPDAAVPPPDGAPRAAFPPKRLYRIQEGAMLAGICNGLAEYFHVDVTLIRVGCVLLALASFGLAALAYLLLAVLIPRAVTPAEMAATRGPEPTAQDFIRRAREGYYAGLKSWGDKQARREWKRKFKQEMRGFSHQFQQEARAEATHWQQNWRQHWSRQWRPPPTAGLLLALPFLALFRGFIVFVGLCAILSLLTTDRIFGHALPADLPWWAGLLLLLALLNILLWPFKVIRHGYWHGSWDGACGAPGWFLLGDTLLGLVTFLLCLWLADRYIPHFHEMLLNLPAAIRHVLDEVRAWWQQA